MLIRSYNEGNGFLGRNPFAKLWPHNAFEFSDATGLIQFGSPEFLLLRYVQQVRSAPDRAVCRFDTDMKLAGSGLHDARFIGGTGLI